jgi:hypothetical protein
MGSVNCDGISNGIRFCDFFLFLFELQLVKLIGAISPDKMVILFMIIYELSTWLIGIWKNFLKTKQDTSNYDAYKKA